MFIVNSMCSGGMMFLVLELMLRCFKTVFYNVKPVPHWAVMVGKYLAKGV